MRKPKPAGRNGANKRNSKFGGKRPSATPRNKKFYTPKKAATPPPEDDGKIRLNRFIANAGICSRREADTLISSGAIKVNGKVVTELGTKIDRGDRVHYGSELIRGEKKQYILLNKPKDYITTSDDPQGRRTVLDLVRRACKERVYPVGRLDRATTGVLLITNDGDLTRKLTHPSSRIRKLYHVSLDKPVAKSDLHRLVEGFELEDGFTQVDKAVYIKEGIDKSQLGLELHSGKNRIIRRMMEHLGYKVTKLDRVSFAGLTKKDIPRGRWRMLTEKDLQMLQRLQGPPKKQQRR